MVVEVVEPGPFSKDDMWKVVKSMFPGTKEWITENNDFCRALLLHADGHIPTKYEFAQIDDDDWEWMRSLVDEKGSKSFSDRLTMLEESRP